MKKIFKIYLILPLVLLLLFIYIFAGWFLLPKKTLDIVIINKTVPAAKSAKITEGESEYRKQVGLFWLLNQQKYCKADGSEYNYKSDYYGPLLDDKGQQASVRKLESLSKTPNLIYISDSFGEKGNKDDEYSGITYQDISAISTAHQNGAMLISEFNITSAPTETTVSDEIGSLFGVTFSDWSGRYVAELSDKDDIPQWAMDLHEIQYGRPWDYKGEGMLLVSNSGEIIVLQKGIDYDKDIFNISITKDYEKEYGKLKLNFYNWFHIIDSNFDTRVIAQFNFNLNDTGKQKFSKISSKLTFPAVTVNGSSPEAYYFAGDFNDYVTKLRNYKFVGALEFNQFFSYDRHGDISHFYWKFYTPLMKKLLKKAEAIKPANPVPITAAQSRINNGKFEVLKNGEWTALTLKGFNINATIPGKDNTGYTRDITLYKSFLTQISSAGGNCIRAYDLYPPEFYRALTEFNNQNAQPIYLVQSAKPPASITDGQYTGESVQEAMKKQIALTVDALHGNAVITKDNEMIYYRSDVSPYLLSFIGELSFTAQNAKNLNASGYRFNGSYLTADKGAESSLAFFCDYLFEYQQTKYGFVSPVGAKGNAALVSGAPWSPAADSQFNPANIRSVSPNFFLAYALLPDDQIFLDNKTTLQSFNDSQGANAYGGYISFFKGLQTNHPLLIDRFGFATNSSSGYDELQGKTEQEQGNEIVRTEKVIQTAGYLGGLISDFNDGWISEQNVFTALNIPSKNDKLWKNALDPAENRGIVSVEPNKPSSVGMSLKDSERMNEMSISHDESYVYMTILLTKEIDYDKEQLVIGLDTYQRNNGEYLYVPDYYATSLSGMEFILKFESKISGGLYVVPSYDVKKGSYSSKESYAGIYDFVTQLRYGTFETSGNNFYLTGSTLHIRLPWGLLNFTDPANHLVINDTRTAAEITADPFGLQVTSTDGIIFSLVITSKETKDTQYIFPRDKQSSAFKTYKWDKWERLSYLYRQKSSLAVIAKYFKELS